MRSPEENLGEIATVVGHFFPHHEEALRAILASGKMNNDRWNQAAAVLGSLGAVPPAALSLKEQNIRNVGLMGVGYARSMARVAFGGASSSGAPEMAQSIFEAIFSHAQADVSPEG